MQHRVIVHKSKLHRGVHKRQPLELTHYIGKLYRVLFQKLATCRHIEKQIFNHQVAAGATCFRLLTLHLTAVYYKPCANSGAVEHGAQIYPRHSRYGGESLAAKPHCVQAEQVGCSGNLGCGVALECKAGIGITHAAAVIHHLYQSASGILYYDFY